MSLNFPDTIFQFVIVGAVNSSPAYSLLREDKIRIFDVIEAVNDKSASDLLIPSKDPQECVDVHLKQQVSMKMRINRSISLPPVSYTLDCGKYSCAVITVFVVFFFFVVVFFYEVKGTVSAKYIIIVAENRNRDVLCIFLGQENGNVRIRNLYITFILLRFCLQTVSFLATSCLLHADTVVPLTLTVLLSHMCDTPVLTTSAIDSPITCIKTS